MLISILSYITHEGTLAYRSTCFVDISVEKLDNWSSYIYTRVRFITKAYYTVDSGYSSMVNFSCWPGHWNTYTLM